MGINNMILKKPMPIKNLATLMWKRRNSHMHGWLRFKHCFAKRKYIGCVNRARNKHRNITLNY